MQEIMIKKRDNRLEALDISKIQKQTKAATANLKNVSQSELELDAKINFVDGISSEQIQQALIKTAVDKIDIDAPDWTFVASRLFLYDLYHKVAKSLNQLKTHSYPHLETYINHGIECQRLNPTFHKKFNLQELNLHIKPERDFQFTYLGVKTLFDRYLIKDKDNNPIELPQHMFMAIAMFLAQNEQNPTDKAKQFYDVLSKFEVMLATPTLSNARTSRHQLSSCYIGSTPDNIEGIFDAYKEMALLSKFGGGIGWDWSKVRSMGGSIAGHKNAAGGTIPFLKVANDIAVAVDQLGVRKGAISVYIEPWHQDIQDFIDLKKNSGEERRRTHELFPALWIPDLFMERVINDQPWTLFDPFEVQDLTEVNNKEFNELYIRYEKDPTKNKVTIRAKELWKKIILSYFESGSPFLCFKDTANRFNPNSHNGIIRSSNLCFTGDTMVAVADGRDVISIKQLAEESKGITKFPVFCAKEDTTNIWEETVSQAIAFKTGTKPVITVVLDNGTSFRCTPDHELALLDGGYIKAKDSVGSLLREKSELLVTGLEVMEVIDNNEVEDVYDLTVDDTHNFFIFPNTADEPILVHNCTEIFQNTEPNYYLVKILFKDEKGNKQYVTYPEHYQVFLPKANIYKSAKDISSLDTIRIEGDFPQNIQVYCVEKIPVEGKTAVCNLASINLSKINTPEDIARVTPIAINMLDNVIDLNFYPVAKVKDTNLETRAIGLGVMGEAEMLASQGIMFGSQVHLNKINHIMEHISYHAINSSSDLAKEKGHYPNFPSSKWQEGIFPFDNISETNKALTPNITSLDWESLRNKVKTQGIRNGYLMAIAPTSSISILVGTTQTIEPIYKKKWFEVNLSGLIPTVVPNLNLDTWNLYQSAYDIPQDRLVKAGAIRQRWIDQGQSLNIFVDPDKINGKMLSDLYILAWELGIKSTYYLRSKSPDEAKVSVADRSLECHNCQ